MHIQLTKFELSRIIGLRALQLENGAPHLVDIDNSKLREDCTYVAAMELKEKKLIYKVNRIYPLDNVNQESSDTLILPNELLTLIFPS